MLCCGGQKMDDGISKSVSCLWAAVARAVEGVWGPDLEAEGYGSRLSFLAWFEGWSRGWWVKVTAQRRLMKMLKIPPLLMLS